METEVGLGDSLGSLPTQDILWLYEKDDITTEEIFYFTFTAYLKFATSDKRGHNVTGNYHIRCARERMEGKNKNKKNKKNKKSSHSCILSAS